MGEESKGFNMSEMNRLTQLLVTLHDDMTPIGIEYEEDWKSVFMDTPSDLVFKATKGQDYFVYFSDVDLWPEEAKQKLLLASIINYKAKEN